MEVDIGESAKTTALGAAAFGIRETSLIGGLKYSSNIDGSKNGFGCNKLYLLLQPIEIMELYKISSLYKQLLQEFGFAFPQRRSADEGFYHVINVPPFDVDDFSSWKDSSISKALISNTCFQESDSDVEEDTRRNSEFLADLNVEFHDRALLANHNRFYKISRRVKMRSKTYQRRDKDRLENKNTYEDKY
ncbi:hypothetical protein Tco_0805864 [Tanacetum coccineum]